MHCKQKSHCLFPDKCRPYLAVSESIQWCGQPTDSDQHTRCDAGSQIAQGCTGSSETAIRDRIPTSHYTFRWDDMTQLLSTMGASLKASRGQDRQMMLLMHKSEKKNCFLLCSYIAHGIGFILYAMFRCKRPLSLGIPSEPCQNYNC